MTITITTSSSGPYIAAAQTTFAVTFQSAGVSEIEVLLADVVQSPSLYVFTRDADGTGQVVFTLAVTGSVLIKSKPNFAQPTSFARFGAFFPDLINTPIDRLGAVDIFLKGEISRVDAAILTASGGVVTAGSAPAQTIEFTALAGQTVFNFLSTAISGFVSVFLNGVRLPAVDFTHVGATVTLAVGATLGDVVTLVGFTQSAVLTSDVNLATLAASGGSALVGFQQAGAGAVVRTTQNKMRDFVSVTDFGAAGDGVVNDTAAFQAAMLAAITLNRALYVPNPPVEYLITGSLDVVYSAVINRGLKIYGNSYGGYFNNGGSIIKYTGTGYLFRVLGRNAGDGGVNAGHPMSVEITGLTIKGTGVAQGAVLIQRAWYIRVTNCTFFDFANTAYGTIVVNAVGTGEAFAGEVTIAENNFQSCGVNVFLTGNGGVLNVARITNNKGLDQAYGVKSDFLPGAPYTSNIQIVGNHWEGTTISDIYSQGVAQGWLILGNYFEQNNAAQNGSRIRFEGTGNRAIVVTGNTFFKQLGAASTSLVYIINGDGCSVTGNFSNYGGQVDRYSVDLVSCANSRAEVMTPNTGASYPIRVNNYSVASGMADTDFIKIASTGSGQFVGISSGDGYPGGTVCTTSNFYNKSNALITFNFKATITTKAASGTATLIGLLPLSNSANDIVFPVRATNVTGAQPFWAKLPSGSNVATVFDAAGVALNYQTAIAVGSILEGQFAYISQS